MKNGSMSTHRSRIAASKLITLPKSTIPRNVCELFGRIRTHYSVYYCAVRRLWLQSRFSRSQFLYIITGCSLRRVVNHVSSECSTSHLFESVLCRHATFIILENFVAILLLFCTILYMELNQPCRSLSRDAILAVNNRRRYAVLDWETRDVIARLHLRRRGCRAGEHRRRQLAAAEKMTSSVNCVDEGIPVILGNRRAVNKQHQLFHGRRDSRATVLRVIERCQSQHPLQKLDSSLHLYISNSRNTLPPSLYLLNAAGLAKPHAIEHLSADLLSYSCDVAVITESHFKTKHTVGVVSIPEYSVLRRDRLGRRGGGVAVYVRSSLSAIEWIPTMDNRNFELLWVCFGDTFLGALYHPPRPSYNTPDLINFIDVCLTELISQYPHATIILAGDFNQLSDTEIVDCTGLISIVTQPTRAASYLDRIYVSSPVYSTVRVVKSLVRSDHHAVVAYVDRPQLTNKTVTQKTYRRISPVQHAAFLQYISTVDLDLSQTSCSVQEAFDAFYETATGLLNHFYPECTISVTSRDPAYVTPSIKAKLRRKNRLMRAGRVEKANALAAQISKEITRRNKKRLCSLNHKTDIKSVWKAVRQVTGARRRATEVDGISAESLNSHYASTSTDPDYLHPIHKSTCSAEIQHLVSEWTVFRMLDQLQPTSTGLDLLPAWFLKLAAPVFCKPIAHLFNLSISVPSVPQQWKCAWISPIPKLSTPKTHSDYRPISITPILSRIMERLVVRQFLYPAFLTDNTNVLSFSDQFAFRPSGSTTAALIWILHTTTQLLSNHDYVIIIALDFSKAFDTVRHSALFDKFADLEIPDNVYNWLVEFFQGHSHCTRYGHRTSALREISASIVQGSAIGPASYVVTASDLTTTIAGNLLCKYADDTYLIIPAQNYQSRSAEIDHIETWAARNNLHLNRAKCAELIISEPKRRRQFNQPPCISDITRVSSLKILGVTITGKMSVSEHVDGLLLKPDISSFW